jgi:hypothetical protein
MEEYKVLSQELKVAARGGNFSRKYRAIKNRENTFRKVICQSNLECNHFGVSLSKP